MPLLGLASTGPSRYAKERQVAIAAVLQASAVAHRVFKELVTEETITKKDKSPVTVGDYTAQALVNLILSRHFPADPIVGEEDSAELRQPSQAPVLARIIDLANAALSTPLPSPADESAWSPLRVRSPLSSDDWLREIDRGTYGGGPKGRMWALDPIDGTKGFLRGGQYAVCLALIEDGEVVVGVMGCPNLPLDFRRPSTSAPSPSGVLFVAEKGCGAFQRPLADASGGGEEPVVMTPRTPSTLASHGSFCESVESGHSDQGTNAAIARELGITKEPVRMDSQAKYCSIARGDGDVYLRLPTSATYEEKIWDHASGSLLVAEAGGVVTDAAGSPLDFSVGRTLKRNKGVVAAHRDVHEAVVAAVKKAVVASA